MASTTAMTPGARRSRAFWLVALLAGIGAAVLVVVALRAARAGRTGTASAPMVTVAVAARDIPATTRLEAGMLRLQPIPRDAMLSGAQTSVAALTGQVTRVALQAGEQVTTAKVAATVKDASFAAAVPADKRALSIKVSEVIGTGGLLVPGDHVDVIGVFQVFDKDAATATNLTGSDSGDKPKKFISGVVLQDVEVLAVAQQVPQGVVAPEAKASSGSVGSTSKKGATDAPKDAQPDAKSVTLAVTQQQAEKLFLAEQMGTLRLALRPVGATPQPPAQPVINSVTDLLAK